MAQIGQRTGGLRQHDRIAYEQDQRDHDDAAEQQARPLRGGIAVRQPRRDDERARCEHEHHDGPRRRAQEQAEVGQPVAAPVQFRRRLHEGRQHVLGQQAVGEGHPGAVGLFVQSEEHQAHRDHRHQRDHLVALHAVALGRDEPDEPAEHAEHHHDHQRERRRDLAAELDRAVGHGPHESGHRQQADDRRRIDQPFARQADEAFAQPRRVRRLGVAAQVLLAPEELQQAQQHARAGDAEAVGPAQGLAQIAADDGREQRAEVDAGVEQREARIAARILGRIQLADDGRDIGFEKAHAHDDQREREIEREQRAGVALHHAVDDACLVPFDGHARMAEHQQQSAEQHRLAHAQPAVGEQPADDRQAVDQAAVGADHVIADVVAELVMLQQIEQQQRLHAVERKAFPHLGEEADVDAFGMTEERVRRVVGSGG